MKSLILIVASIFSLNVMAGGLNPDKYCAKTKDGKVIVMHEGKTVTSTVTLTNGVQIMTDGTIVKKDGTKTMIKEGQCADANGDIMKEEKK